MSQETLTQALEQHETYALQRAHSSFRFAERVRTRINAIDEAAQFPWGDWTLTLWPDQTMSLHRWDQYGFQYKPKVTPEQLDCSHEEGKGFCSLCGWIYCTGCPASQEQR
jgi:hypothetical protein